MAVPLLLLLSEVVCNEPINLMPDLVTTNPVQLQKLFQSSVPLAVR